MNMKNIDIGNFLFIILISLLIITVLDVYNIAFATTIGEASFFEGRVGDLVDKSTTTIKMVRFIAVFIVIGGLIWAGVEFAIKNDQQKGATVLISAVIGAFFVLLAPTIMNFVIGGIFGTGGIDKELPGMSAGTANS